MVKSPSWEANWFAANQEIPHISRNPKVHYHTHKRPPPVSILCQPNPVHIPTSHLLEIHPNIIHPSTPRSPQWFLLSGFPTKTLYTPLSSPIRATCPAHLILLYFIYHYDIIVNLLFVIKKKWRDFFAGVKVIGAWKLTAYQHLVKRFRLTGVIPLPPSTAPIRIRDVYRENVTSLFYLFLSLQSSFLSIVSYYSGRNVHLQ